MAKVVWSPAALADMEAIAEYIARDSADRASLLVARIINATRNLYAFPRMGHSIAEIPDPDCREIIVGNYRLMYRLLGDEVWICERFHLVAKELRHRRGDRQALEMNDEYDVQYLLGALLKLDFDDVRAEEPTPSCAGKSSRIDFFLQDEGLAVEAKRTRDGLKNDQLGTELNDDKGRYRKMAGCRGLVCLVYDPEELLKNPTAVEKDLSENQGGFLVRAVVSPRRT